MSPLNPLNPAAGDVPIPEDQREIDAALKAGRISHRLFPYIDLRYGERGRKFTQSDSAWLAWLTRFEIGRVTEQIIWLRNVLSNRGMPSWILETHLVIMHRQLARMIPEKRQQYHRLALIADRLREDRQQYVPTERGARLAAGFAGAFGRKMNWLLVGTGHLIVAAVADQKLGIKNAISSFVPWMLDAPRALKSTEYGQRVAECILGDLRSDACESTWKNAVETTVEDARNTKPSVALNR